VEVSILEVEGEGVVPLGLLEYILTLCRRASIEEVPEFEVEGFEGVEGLEVVEEDLVVAVVLGFSS